MPTVGSQVMAGLEVTAPRMEMVALAVLEGIGAILTLGAMAARSPMLRMPRCSSSLLPKAVMAMGVSCRDWARFWAVTTTSSTMPLDWARAGVAARMARGSRDRESVV